MINPRPAVELTHEGISIIIISIHPRSRSGMTSLKRSAKMNSLPKIVFQRPVHGWMVVTVDTTESDVSDASCDSLYGLCKAIKCSLEGESARPVEWFIEPGYEKWSFEIEENFCRFTIVGVDGLERYTTFVNTLDLMKIMVCALQDVVEICKDSSDMDLHWSWDFPTDSLQAIQTNFT
jgi:hypothetical protein